MPAAPPPPDVTVVLPVRNEGAHLEAVLGDVLGQDLGDLRIEVLVVDGESDDDTVAVARRVAARDERVAVLNNPFRLSSGARAIGARRARGKMVLYVDGHCRVPSRTLVRDMASLFERTGAACLSRPQPLETSRPGYRARAIAAARTSPFGHSIRSTIYDHDERAVSPVSAGAMYRREVFDRVGNFDPSFDACEDVEFNWRCEAAGLACWTSPKLALAYEPRRTLRGLFRQMARYGLGRARLHKKHPKAFSLESLVPAAFVAGLPFALASPFVGAPWGWILAAPYGLYVLLALLFSVLAARRTSWALLPALPAAFFTLHLGLGYGYLKGLVTPRPRVAAADLEAAGLAAPRDVGADAPATGGGGADTAAARGTGPSGGPPS